MQNHCLIWRGTTTVLFVFCENNWSPSLKSGKAFAINLNNENVFLFSLQQAEEIVQTAYDHGINIFDTADAYAGGRYD